MDELIYWAVGLLLGALLVLLGEAATEYASAVREEWREWRREV